MGGWGLGNPNLVRILKTVRNIGQSLKLCQDTAIEKELLPIILRIVPDSGGLLGQKVYFLKINGKPEDYSM